MKVVIQMRCGIRRNGHEIGVAAAVSVSSGGGGGCFIKMLTK
jgi:hypothetical protein